MMPARLPLEVRTLLDAASPADRDAAWDDFVAGHSRLILYAARSVSRDRDEAMDAYAWTLERLRERDCHSLRGFSEGKGALFSTWLVVVARRICLDFIRHKRGRSTKAAAGTSPEWVAVRRRLVDLVGEPVDLDDVPFHGAGADDELEARERTDALGAALRTLSPSERVLLALRFEDGCSASQIARAMRFPTPFHVYRRLHAVLGALRRRLRDAGLEGPED